MFVDRLALFVGRLLLWGSRGRVIDGLWIGSMESEPEFSLGRVEDALLLIKHCDGVHYSRVIRNLSRIWVNLIPDSVAHYNCSLNACVLDERYIRNEATTTEDIASSIVHEATHARLEKWGVVYDEAKRPRIEAICVRRQLNFVSRLPDNGPFQQKVVDTLKWLADDHAFFSDANFQRRDQEGVEEALRYLNTPNWLIRWANWRARRREQRAALSGP